MRRPLSPTTSVSLALSFSTESCEVNFVQGAKFFYILNIKLSPILWIDSCPNFKARGQSLEGHYEGGETDHVRTLYVGPVSTRIKVKPYIYPVNFKGHFYYRSGSTNQELRGSSLHHFLLDKVGQSWDGMIVQRAKMSELDSKVLTRSFEN